MRWPPTRWPWQRRSEPTPATSAVALPGTPDFDASIDVDLSHVDRDARRAVVAEVARRVEALPGAGWISVEPHAPAAGVAARVFPAGSSQEAEAPVWLGLRRRVETVVREVLSALPGEGWSVPAPMQQGFAEAMAPSQLDALAQLAALAAISRAPLPPEPPAAAKPPARKRAEKRAEAPALNALADSGAAAADTGAEVRRLAKLLEFVLPVDAHEPAAAAVRRFGSFAAVLAAPEVELRRVPGLGTHSIAAIKLVHAAAVRLARAGVAARPVLADKQRLADYLAAALARERIEQFRILFLDEDGMLQADEVQATGTVNHTPVYPREVVRRALALGASSLVLVHNHPSGDPEPSRDDIEMTRQVRAAAAVMSIEVRDHVIVGNGRWLSFRERGLL
ncbi:MAG: hypothetical protein NVSMB18_22680 [Acetobacteraceae bacterium]